MLERRGQWRRGGRGKRRRKIVIATPQSVVKLDSRQKLANFASVSNLNCQSLKSVTIGGHFHGTDWTGTQHYSTKIVMYRHPTGTFPDYRRRLGSVTLAGQGLGLGTSLFPVGAMEIKGTVR